MKKTAKRKTKTNQAPKRHRLHSLKELRSIEMLYSDELLELPRGVGMLMFNLIDISRFIRTVTKMAAFAQGSDVGRFREVLKHLHDAYNQMSLFVEDFAMRTEPLKPPQSFLPAN